MKRRTFLQISVPAVAGLSLPACKRAVGSVEPEALPLVLSGGNVFLQNKWQPHRLESILAAVCGSEMT
jgi:hypothetical protein